MVDDLTAEMSATRRLVCVAVDRADRVAFVGGARHDGGPGGESYSYASFGSTVQAAAAGLTWRGLRPRDVVGVMVPDAVSFAIAVHAIRAAGGVPSPVNSALCAVETAGQLAESGARMVITSPPLAEVALAAADRSWVRQVFSFADAAGTTRFGDLLGLDTIRPSRAGRKTSRCCRSVAARMAGCGPSRSATGSTPAHSTMPTTAPGSPTRIWCSPCRLLATA